MLTEINIRGIDFHCHVDLHPNPTSIIMECENRHIAVLAVTTTPKAWYQNLQWTKNSKFVHAAVGLHPELVGTRFAEVDLLESSIAESSLIGEVGLDGSPQYRSVYSKQKEVFARTLIAAQRYGGRVISIHSRRATRDVIESIATHTDPSRVLCILHWFSGSSSDLNHAVALGCYFSVNSAMLQHNRGVDLVKSIPIDRLLTETDSPFVELGGIKSVPWDTVNTCKQLAYLLDYTVHSVKDRIIRNASTVFRFAGLNLQ